MSQVFQAQASTPMDPAPSPSSPNGDGGRAHRLVVRLLKSLPKSVVRLASSPYIAGEDLPDALRVADELMRKKGLYSTLDVLGEAVSSQQDIEDYYTEFLKLIEELRTRPHANISLKLSALGQQQDEDACWRRCRELVLRARELGSFVRLDMEDHTTIDSTLRIYRRLREEFDNTGIVLQSRLFRTAKDIEGLSAYVPNVRLCIGIYPEPTTIALTDKVAMKRHMLELLATMWRNGQHVALATHEEWVIREALELATRLGKPLQQVEVQMLLGVPRDALQQELRQRGVRVRLYVPYGRQWYAYSMRRLEHNPEMLRMVAGNVLHGLLRRR